MEPETLPTFDNNAFLDGAKKYGVSYALIELEKAAKKRQTGKNLSASEYAKAEKKIRKMVQEAKFVKTVSSPALYKLFNDIKASSSLYFDYDPDALWEIDIFHLEPEKQPEEWVKYGLKKKDAETAKEPTKTTEDHKRKFGFSFFR